MYDLTMFHNELSSMARSVDAFGLLVFGSAVLLMQSGFAFLQAGSVRGSNTSNILINTLLGVMATGLVYWAIGYALGQGEGNAFVGWTKWASWDVSDLELAQWYFQFATAATAANIVPGALAERCRFVAHLVVTCLISGVVYPIVTHWAWNGQGWLLKGHEYSIEGERFNIGYFDYAGSGVVHVLGGVSAFFGALIIGPRIGRFHTASSGNQNHHDDRLKGHSAHLTALGGFILIFGFLAFNGGSQLAISTVYDAEKTASSIVNTVLSGSSSAFVTLVGYKIVDGGDRAWSVLYTVNSCLVGMVSVSAGCNVIMPWAAVCIGAVASIVYRAISKLVDKLKVDDPLDAVAVHFGGGAWGVLGVALFHRDVGALVTGNETSKYTVGWQLVGLISITAWTAGTTSLVFWLMRRAGVLRVSREVEIMMKDFDVENTNNKPTQSQGHLEKQMDAAVVDNGERCNKDKDSQDEKDPGRTEENDTLTEENDTLEKTSKL